MINDFLASLDNTAAAPGDVVWPSFSPRVLSNEAVNLRNKLIGRQLPRRQHFLRCLELVACVEESPHVGVITSRDPRVTYTRAQVQRLLQARGVTVAPGGVYTAGVVVNTSGGASEYDRFVVTTTDGSAFSVTNAMGVVTPTTVSYSSGLSSPIQTGSTGRTLSITNGPAAASSSWTVTVYEPTESHIQRAAASFEDFDVLPLLDDDWKQIYRKSALRLDKLAVAVIAAAGYAGT